jgi:hypothetical protein
LTNASLKEDTLFQIQKDFGRLWTINTPEKWEYEWLFSSVLEIIERKHQHAHFMQLMYKIDIPEEDYKAALKAKNSNEILAELIIKREFLKVLLRKNYSLEAAQNLFKMLKETN